MKVISSLRRRALVLAAGATGVAVVVAVSAILMSGTSSDAATTRPVLGPGTVTVRLDVEHSHFAPTHVVVRRHTTVRFVVVNHDPIGHELIVGDAAVHALHATGTEAAHAPRPGEVSVPPNSRATTTFMFHDVGTVLYACHLPGHFEYGMKGTVEVVDGAS